MAYDFPATPVVGQTYTFAGITYTWDGIAWSITAAPMVTPTASAKNLLANPNAMISQENGRNASPTAVTNVAYFPADQWTTRWSVSPATLFGQSASLGANFPGLSNFYIGLTTVTPKASLATGDYALITQPIEGVRFVDLQWGSSRAIPAVLAFTARSPVPGLYSVRLVDSTAARSFVATFVLAAADTWQRIVVPIPPDYTGTWMAGLNKGGSIDFTCAVGATYVGVAGGGWQAGNVYAVPGQAVGISVAGLFAIAEVGLYADPLATGLAPPFVPPDYAEEMIRCKRYWNILNNVIINPNTNNSSTYYGVSMRTTPTISGVPAVTTGVVTPDLADIYATRAYTNVTLNARM